ncbi:MAG TPA: four helix bundle protein [Phycisphaerae bacterium]|nr:four helix bundle protein [Phycisphaerae bacterium]
MSKYGQSASPFGFEDLDVYKAARRFRQRIYALAKMLPSHEQKGLADQMRRASVSVTSNIAEGYGRHHWQENTQFCRHSRGSLMELIDQIHVCIDERYADKERLEQFKREDCLELLKLLNGYIGYLQRKKAVSES